MKPKNQPIVDYLVGQYRSYQSAYEKTILAFYADEIRAAEQECRLKRIPEYRQFVYWAKRLFNDEERIKKQTTAGDFTRNKRALLGAATDNPLVPGSCFELDATVVDVHIVSPLRRNHVLGRPTIYSVIDKESRMITALHVSLEYASFRAGHRHSLTAFHQKKPFVHSLDWRLLIQIGLVTIYLSD